jgi:hypothetical protein
VHAVSIVPNLPLHYSENRDLRFTTHLRDKLEGEALQLDIRVGLVRTVQFETLFTAHGGRV